MSLIDAAAADEALRTVTRAPQPRPPTDQHVVQRRMRETVRQLLTGTASVTERDLERAGFSRAEIADHFTAACRAVKAHRLAA